MPILGKELCTVSFNFRMTEREYRALMHHGVLVSRSASAVLRELIREHVITQYLDVFGGTAEFQIELPIPK